MTDIGYAWKPIEAPVYPTVLAVEEMRALTKLWQRQRERLSRTQALQKFQDRMDRWWSIETGIIERLYDVSDGTTLMLIEQGFVASLVQHGESTIPAEELIQILGDHRDALHMVMDLVGGTRAFTVGWIKELHALITRSQHTTEALSSLGQYVEVPLLHGDYKKAANNPKRRDGLMHEYCPAEHVASEMDRLVTIYNSLPANLPEVRAAWLHHAFTQIHPFQDGNGRVARALASIDFIRGGLFPLIVTRKDREIYLDRLARADEGNLRPLIQFFGTCIERVMLRAISEAESVVGQAESLSAVLEAMKQKVADREVESKPTREAMTARLEKFAKLAEYQLNDARDQVKKAVPKISISVSRVDPKTTHFFFHQVIEIARRQGYWADMNEPRGWARMQLRNGGTTDIVIVLHFVGNPSPGSCIAAVFVDHRDVSTESVGANPAIMLPVEPLLLTAEEDEDAQKGRFLEWLGFAVVQALAQWTRYL